MLRMVFEQPEWTSKLASVCILASVALSGCGGDSASSASPQQQRSLEPAASVQQVQSNQQVDDVMFSDSALLESYIHNFNQIAYVPPGAGYPELPDGVGDGFSMADADMRAPADLQIQGLQKLDNSASTASYMIVVEHASETSNTLSAYPLRESAEVITQTIAEEYAYHADTALLTMVGDQAVTVANTKLAEEDINSGQVVSGKPRPAVVGNVVSVQWHDLNILDAAWQTSHELVIEGSVVHAYRKDNSLFVMSHFSMMDIFGLDAITVGARLLPEVQINGESQPLVSTCAITAKDAAAQMVGGLINFTEIDLVSGAVKGNACVSGGSAAPLFE